MTLFHLWKQVRFRHSFLWILKKGICAMRWSVRSTFRGKESHTQQNAFRQRPRASLHFWRNTVVYSSKAKISFVGLKTKRNIEFFSLFSPQFLAIKENLKKLFGFLSTTPFEPRKFPWSSVKAFFWGKRLMLMGRKVPFSKETIYFSKVIIEEVFHNKIFKVSG